LDIEVINIRPEWSTQQKRLLISSFSQS
jgi:hypothetical protein